MVERDIGVLVPVKPVLLMDRNLRSDSKCIDTLGRHLQQEAKALKNVS